MKKILLLIACVLLFSTLVPQKANALENENIKNLKFIVQNSKELIYTFTEEGKNYKAVEKFSDDGKKVNTKIYKTNSKELKLVDKFTTTLNNETVTQTNKNGQQSDFKLISESPTNQQLSFAKYKSDWNYHKSWKGNNKFTKWSVGAIAIVLAGITKMPASAVVIINLAGYTYGMNAKTVYYSAKDYKDGNAPRLRPNFKQVTNIYANSARTKVIKKGVVSYNCTSTCTHN